ncbi:hypothetical protein BT96DRAFT_931043 [Gymnopus androsaceus JB14]|uniref:Uncharacterized protein n=1 Tax=Gymnopus androsaceus JB14 TaxID=1447944 RepID=A0A6A4IL08_9AGAR|nr:hypothetical protein BT96DRAFT_931043 [Gymnopus androsaceus JB14]
MIAFEEDEAQQATAKKHRVSKEDRVAAETAAESNKFTSCSVTTGHDKRAGSQDPAQAQAVSSQRPVLVPRQRVLPGSAPQRSPQRALHTPQGHHSPQLSPQKRIVSNGDGGENRNVPAHPEGSYHVNERRDNSCFTDLDDCNAVDASGGGGNPPPDDEDHGGHNKPPRRNNPQQVRISGTHGPCLNDYDAATKAVLHLAIEQLHVRLANENAWPDTMEKSTWARLCWDEAESTLGADMNPNIDILKIMSYSLSYMPAITLLCFSPRFLIEI